MQDGTYLSRNFATLGPLTSQPPCGRFIILCGSQKMKGIQELVNRLALLKVSRNNPNNRSIVSVSTLQELGSQMMESLS